MTTQTEMIEISILQDLRLLQESRGRWQYKFNIHSSWMTANTEEDAIERATEAYHRTPESERLTSQQREDRANADEFIDMDRRYGKRTIQALRADMERFNVDIAINHRAGQREFNGNGGRRSRAAVSNEAARAASEERMRMERYIVAREAMMME